jgi:nucleotide-binding universal stress UspA family protein
MYKKILVPLDGSELAECVLPHVESIAKGCGVQEIVFLRAVEPLHWIVGPAYTPGSTDDKSVYNVQDRQHIYAESKSAAENYLTQLADRTKYDGISVQTQVVFGPAAVSIVDYAKDNATDLIIIATHGRSGISRWVMGSVADRVLRSAHVPVLMVRAPGCEPGI